MTQSGALLTNTTFLEMLFSVAKPLDSTLDMIYFSSFLFFSHESLSTMEDWIRAVGKRGLGGSIFNVWASFFLSFY